MKIKIPDNAEIIIKTLSEHGYEAYVVGGCVRDSILNRKPGDWDITTSATPDQVKRIFRRTIDTGIEHGTVTVMLNQEGYEVTTYRIDGDYVDHRHPTNVAFTNNLVEDLKRRDFTINAMAYNYKANVVDMFHGLDDLQNKIIRCVGAARDRFDEDALRILRALRFAAQLGFDIEADTKKAIIEKRNLLSKISAERIRVELTKLICSMHPQMLEEAYKLGVTKLVLPEFDRIMETKQENESYSTSVGEHTLKALEYVAKLKQESKICISEKEYIVLCFSTLLHDIGKPYVIEEDESNRLYFSGHEINGESLSKKILKRLKFDNYTIENVAVLVRWHEYPMENSAISIRRLASIIGKERMELFFKLKEANIKAKQKTGESKELDDLKICYELYKKIMEEQQCVTIKELSINGKDLIKLGITPGKEMGQMLSELLEAVIQDPTLNTKEALTKLVLNN